MSSSSSISSDDERENSAQLALPSPPGSRPSSRASSRCSSPQSPRKRRNGGLPSAGGIGATLQNTVEELIQRDVLDTGVVVELANSKEAQQKLEDLLPIHFYSWRLKNVEAALVYTLLHMFVLLQQYNEMVRERSVYEDYISHLKAQLEEDQQPEVGSQQHEREEVVRLRRENAELRQEKAKLQASQSELYQINDAWSRDYNSLTKKIEALTSGSWSTSSNGTSTHHLTNGTPVTHAPATTAEQHQNARTPTHPPSFALSHASHSHACPNCFSLQEQLDQLSRQAKELGRKNRDLEKLLEEEERKSKQKDMLIKSLDSENQAVQLQIQEIGDLQAAARLKEDFRKLELKMRQLDKQHQDTTSKKIQLQQQVDKLRHAFMSILGVSSSSRRHHHDCRVQQYMSEPLPPPPTPPVRDIVCSSYMLIDVHAHVRAHTHTRAHARTHTHTHRSSRKSFQYNGLVQ
jgi:hypothetical protein